MSYAAFDSLKALVIEDNQHMRTLLRSLLIALGVKNVFEAVDGETGFEELRSRRPDFVLTDLSMKPTDGIEFTKRVRHSNESPNPYVPIIMVTGHTERLRVEGARDAGVTEFLAKPITAQNLLRAVLRGESAWTIARRYGLRVEDLLAHNGLLPRAVLRIDVREAYFHCGKALMRSKLWTTERVERKVMPSIGEVIHDQTGLGERESQEVIYERYKTQL